MKYTFKYQPNKGNYAIYKGKRKHKEVKTLQDAESVVEFHNEQNKKELGFGTWGIPDFMKKAS